MLKFLVFLCLQTPGPAAYKAVDPCIFKSKPPQYSMTGRNFTPSMRTRTPGPGSHNPEKVQIPLFFYLYSSSLIPTKMYLFYFFTVIFFFLGDLHKSKSTMLFFWTATLKIRRTCPKCGWVKSHILVLSND